MSRDALTAVLSGVGMPASPFEQRIPQIYAETIRSLYAFVAHRCGPERAMAEDVVQEVWLRAVSAWRKRGIPDAPEAWLIAVARNLVVSYYRRQRALTVDPIQLALALAAVDDGAAREAAGVRDVGDAVGAPGVDVERLIHWSLARLPEREARLIEAFHLERRSIAAIARELRLSERAVEGRLRRARIKLRRVIEKVTPRREARS